MQTHPLDSIHHDGSVRYVKTLFGGPRFGDEVTIRLRTARDAPIQRVLLRTCPDGEQLFSEMRPVSESPACRWWEAILRVSMPAVGYRFLIFTDERTASPWEGAWWYNGSGLHRHTLTDAEDFRLLADAGAPAWVTRSVFYQIFPDRFADGDPTNNVRDGEWSFRDLHARSRRWGEPPSSGYQAMIEFYGGDLPGIAGKLDYLTDLGVNALYLNPIFNAHTNHRYDVTDYDNVDPHLGGNAALAALRRATTARGLRILLDIVPNHCGLFHPWFRAAQADPEAPTAEYFTFRHHPDDYECWLGVRSLPKLNYRSARLRDAMYAGPDAIFRRWLRPPYSVDGWRVDVANMLGRQGADQLGSEIARGIRQAVKTENPEAYLLGENWFDGTAQLGGDGWDATMNYAGFTMPLWYWLAGFSVTQHAEPHAVTAGGCWPTQALVDSWGAFRAAVPWTMARQQFNLVDSHDTARIKAIVGGDPARQRLAAGLLLTYLGVPCIYYGDEIGLPAGDGRADARARSFDDTSGDARACMSWDASTWDVGLQEFYRRLIALRRSSPALSEGGLQVLAVEPDTLAYLRDTDEEKIIVVAHRGPDVRPPAPLRVSHGAIPDGAEFAELLGGGHATVADGCLPLPALPAGVTIWRT